MRTSWEPRGRDPARYRNGRKSAGSGPAFRGGGAACGRFAHSKPSKSGSRRPSMLSVNLAASIRSGPFLAFVSGCVGGAVFKGLGFPLPWTLGSLTAAAVIAVAGLEWKLPNAARNAARPDHRRHGRKRLHRGGSALHGALVGSDPPAGHLPCAHHTGRSGVLHSLLRLRQDDSLLCLDAWRTERADAARGTVRRAISANSCSFIPPGSSRSSSWCRSPFVSSSIWRACGKIGPVHASELLSALDWLSCWGVPLLATSSDVLSRC